MGVALFVCRLRRFLFAFCSLAFVLSLTLSSAVSYSLTVRSIRSVACPLLSSSPPSSLLRSFCTRSLTRAARPYGGAAAGHHGEAARGGGSSAARHAGARPAVFPVLQTQPNHTEAGRRRARLRRNGGRTELKYSVHATCKTSNEQRAIASRGEGKGMRGGLPVIQCTAYTRTINKK